jgi:uncharacterized protein
VKRRPRRRIRNLSRDEAMRWIADRRLHSAGKTGQWQVRGVAFDDGFRKALAGVAQILSGSGRPG